MSVIDQAPIARQVTTAKGSTWPRWNTCHNHCSWLRTLAMSVQALAGASFAGSTRLVLGNEAHANTFAKKNSATTLPDASSRMTNALPYHPKHITLAGSRDYPLRQTAKQAA
mmetsp:Transcript_37661/g.61312  ORF Transcript_37661/g.61312 Transcript_37661/m.61312 type:complete len:112 (+) Transcript_37661:207-542(+)